MKPLIKLTFLLVFFIFSVRTCLAQELASSYQPKSKTEKLVIEKIRALPEVIKFYTLYKYTEKSKPDFIINPPDSANNNCYGMQVGTEYADSFRTNFWLLIDPKTFKIYYWDITAASGSGIITLQQWRYWRNKTGFNAMHYYKAGKLIVINEGKSKRQ